MPNKVCSKCGNLLRYANENVMMSNGNAEIHCIGYCDNCRLRYDLTQYEGIMPSNTYNSQYVPSGGKKKDSKLSTIAAVLGIFTITYFAGLICALIDLCSNDKRYKHVGSWFVIVEGIIFAIIAYVSYVSA